MPAPVKEGRHRGISLLRIWLWQHKNFCDPSKKLDDRLRVGFRPGGLARQGPRVGVAPRRRGRPRAVRRQRPMGRPHAGSARRTGRGRTAREWAGSGRHRRGSRAAPGRSRGRAGRWPTGHAAQVPETHRVEPGAAITWPSTPDRVGPGRPAPRGRRGARRGPRARGGPPRHRRPGPRPAGRGCGG